MKEAEFGCQWVEPGGPCHRDGKDRPPGVHRSKLRHAEEPAVGTQGLRDIHRSLSRGNIIREGTSEQDSWLLGMSVQLLVWSKNCAQQDSPAGPQVLHVYSAYMGTDNQKFTWILVLGATVKVGVTNKVAIPLVPFTSRGNIRTPSPLLGRELRFSFG
eukprot:1674970-Amphidinium_carterae.3